MKLSEDKLNQIRKEIEIMLDDIELEDIEINPVGYRDYEISSFEFNAGIDEALQNIKNIIED